MTSSLPLTERSAPRAFAGVFHDFTPKNLTQGGQMTAYRLRMFAQVNQWIFNWILLLFVLMTGLSFWGITPDDTLRKPLLALDGADVLKPGPADDPSSPATWDILYHCGDGGQLCRAKLTLRRLIADPWMREMGANLWVNLKLCATVNAVFLQRPFEHHRLVRWPHRHEGKRGRVHLRYDLTEDVPAVNRMLKKNEAKSLTCRLAACIWCSTPR
jgi:hypothetical protein